MPRRVKINTWQSFNKLETERVTKELDVLFINIKIDEHVFFRWVTYNIREITRQNRPIEKVRLSLHVLHTTEEV